jgi:hypothetical protein
MQEILLFKFIGLFSLKKIYLLITIFCQKNKIILIYTLKKLIMKFYPY